MYTLTPDERATPMAVYTSTAMLHCEAVVKAALTRISTWLRTQGAPEYLHLINVQMLMFGSGEIKRLQYAELFLPTPQVVAYHLTAATSEPLDYDPNEANRMMQPTILHVGSFVITGSIRIAANSSIGAHLESSHSPWVSIYDIKVGNPNIPGLQYQAPMALFNPSRVIIGMP